jgi:hypothetical protein
MVFAKLLQTKQINIMLYLIAMILIIMWLIGYVGLGIASGVIHLLLILAIVAVLLRVIRGDRML